MAESKFALVDFHERQEVEIVATRDIITERDRSTLNCLDWDRETDVKVLWLQKGKKVQEAHVAKILRFANDRTSLMPFLNAATDGLDVPLVGEMEYGRGKRKHDKREFSDDDSDEPEASVSCVKKQKKIKTAARKKMTENAKHDLLRHGKGQKASKALESNMTPLPCDLRNELPRESAGIVPSSSTAKQIADLKAENEALKSTIAIMQGLPALLQQMKTLKQACDIRLTASAVAGRPTTGTTPSLPSAPVDGSPRPVPAVPRSTGTKRRVFEYDVAEDNKVDLGYGVLANADNLQYVSRVDISKTTYTLCEVLFTKEQLASSSLTGKKSNAFHNVAPKPKLDDSKVRAIIDFVLKMHPAASEMDVKKCIAAKLNIAQKVKSK